MNLIWVCILLVAIGMTCFQINEVIRNLTGGTTKTQMSLLPVETPAKYPPYAIQYKYISSWLDLKKVKDYRLDYDTLMYTMSYFYPIYTPVLFDAAEARKKLLIIMQRHFFDNIYDFGIALSKETPANVVSNETFDRFFDSNGEIYYVAKMDNTFYESSDFLELSEHTIQMRAHSNLDQTPFNDEFVALYNRSFTAEYEWFKLAMYGGENAASVHNLLSTIPIYLNSDGERNAFSNIDIFINDYKYFLTGTLYNWIPNPEANCVKDEEASFHIQCVHRCSQEFKLSKIAGCKLYHTPEEFQIDFEINSRPFCEFDPLLVLGEEYELDQLLASNDSYDRCIEDCTDGCIKWKYHSTKVVYPNQASKTLNTQVTGKVTLSYVKKDNVMVISLLPLFTWYEALAGVGGLLGLWLGGSILAFIQIIYVFCCMPVETVYINRRTMLENEKNMRRQNRIFGIPDNHHWKPKRGIFGKITHGAKRLVYGKAKDNAPNLIVKPQKSEISIQTEPLEPMPFFGGRPLTSKSPTNLETKAEESREKKRKADLQSLKREVVETREKLKQIETEVKSLRFF